MASSFVDLLVAMRPDQLPRNFDGGDLQSTWECFSLPMAARKLPTKFITSKDFSS